MPLNIRNPEADRLAAELARLTGQTKTDAVIAALRQRLAQARANNQANSMVDRIAGIAVRCRQLPVLDKRTPDEILGYDKPGTFLRP
jgi:antitoxin VapB